jgi:hypothetical protein
MTGTVSLLCNATREPMSVDDTSAMKAAGDCLQPVVRLDLKGDDGPVDPDHARLAEDAESFGHRGKVLDLDERAHAPLVILQERGDRGPSRVFQVGNQPGSRQDRRHHVVGKDDPVRWADDHPFLGAGSDPGSRLQGVTSPDSIGNLGSRLGGLQSPESKEQRAKSRDQKQRAKGRRQIVETDIGLLDPRLSAFCSLLSAMRLPTSQSSGVAVPEA